MKLTCRVGCAIVAVMLAMSYVREASADVIISFTNQQWNGFAFTNFLTAQAPQGVVGTLTAVSVNATLNSSVSDTWADDLTVYVNPGALATGGLLQVGGFSNLNATERHSWGNGASPNPGTIVNDSVTLSNAITFNGTSSDPLIWIGNGYGAAGTSGNWTGSVTLVGISAVPEPSTMLLTALGLSAIALIRRRSKTV